MIKKEVCICIPCYNEENNIEPLVKAILQEFQTKLQGYDYNIQFIDNCSTDSTKLKIIKICSENRKVRAIFNAKNFPNESGYYGLLQSEGDCTISIPADFQVPVTMISELVSKWESGAKIVCAVKTSTKESNRMWKLRKLYYKILKKFSNPDIIPNFTGAGLYDKSFLDTCRKINDPVVSMGQLVATIGSHVELCEYEEKKRKTGKSKENILSLFNKAILRFINYSEKVPKYAISAGVIFGCISVIIAITYFVMKLLYWNMFPAGMIPAVLGIFFIGSLQLFFLGLIGEYIIQINKRVMKRPLVIEEERINFTKNEDKANLF